MPVSPLAVAAMLACARIGAVHTVVFAGFSSEALAGRIQDGESSVCSDLKHENVLMYRAASHLKCLNKD